MQLGHGALRLLKSRLVSLGSSHQVFVLLDEVIMHFQKHINLVLHLLLVKGVICLLKAFGSVLSSKNLIWNSNRCIVIYYSEL